MTEEYIIKELLNMEVISQDTANLLRGFKRLSKNSKEIEIVKLNRQICLREDQICRLFVKSLTVAQKDAQQVLSKGRWVTQRSADGESYMIWQNNAVDTSTWQNMPILVKAICVDLSFNIGGNRFADYKKFIKAVKAEDYRRAAIELLDSKDYKDNIDSENKKGVAYRRRDAAIELTKLAEDRQ